MSQSPVVRSRLGPYSKTRLIRSVDGRSVEGRALRRIREQLVAHVGGKPSPTQRLFIERIAVLQLRLSAFTNTDSPTLYSNALLSVATRQPGASTTTHTTTIHQLTVNTKATDPQGVARAVKAALSSPQRMAAVGNTGLQ